jgi:hypothetical protein
MVLVQLGKAAIGMRCSVYFHSLTRLLNQKQKQEMAVQIVQSSVTSFVLGPAKPMIVQEMEHA